MEPTGLEGSTTSYGNGNPLKWSAYFVKKIFLLIECYLLGVWKDLEWVLIVILAIKFGNNTLKCLLEK